MARLRRIAAVQMRFDSDVETNLSTMTSALKRLAKLKTDLVVFPECCLNGYLVDPDKRDWPATASAVKQLRTLARRMKMAVIFGLAEKYSGGKPLNSVLALDRRGTIAGRYSKQHLISWDHDYFTPGQEKIQVFSLVGIKLAMQICYDLRFPEPARAAAQDRAQLITYSLAASGSGGWKKPVMEGHLRSRAAENGLFVLAANRLENIMMMNSRILDPDGRDLAKAPVNKSCEIIADIKPGAAHYRFLSDRRHDLY
jgi:predicted amidohydrolase